MPSMPMFILPGRVRHCESQKKLEPHQKWAPLGVQFKISDKHPCHTDILLLANEN